jgi:hypothetical protein
MSDFHLPPNRHDPPGLSPYRQLDVSHARQLVSHLVESTAVHSKSRGWIPSILVTMEHIPLVGVGDVEKTQIVMDLGSATTFIEVLKEGLEAAQADARYGLREQ